MPYKITLSVIRYLLDELSLACEGFHTLSVIRYLLGKTPLACELILCFHCLRTNDFIVNAMNPSQKSQTICTDDPETNLMMWLSWKKGQKPNWITAM